MPVHLERPRSGGAVGCLRDEIVDALRDRQDLPGLADDESAVVNYGREFFQIRRVNQGRSTQFAGASIPSMLSKKVCQ